MLHTTSLTPMAHLICVAHTRLELAEILVVAPQGRRREPDGARWRPADRSRCRPPVSSRYAVELVELARAIGGFSIGVAAHPAGHPRSPEHWRATATSWRQSWRLADFGDHPVLLRGIRVRGLLVRPRRPPGRTSRSCPGSCPSPPSRSMPRMAADGRGGARVDGRSASRPPTTPEGRGCPQRRRVAGHRAVRRPARRSGVPGLHFYTLNRSSATREIYAALGLGPSLAATG